MDNKKLETANYLRRKIDSIDEFIEVCENNSYMEIKSSPSNNWDKSKSIFVDNIHKGEVIDMIKRWRDEYQKEFEAL